MSIRKRNLLVALKIPRTGLRTLQQELDHIAVAFRVSSDMGQRYLQVALRSASGMRWKALCKRFDLTESEALTLQRG